MPAAHPQLTEPGRPSYPTNLAVPDGLGGIAYLTLEVAEDGSLHARDLDKHDLSGEARQYVTDTCRSWTEALAPRKPADPPRRAQLHFDEVALRRMLGLQEDESLRSARYDPTLGGLTFVVESPRLPRTGYGGTPGWNVEPRYISLPISAHYEIPEGQA